MHLLPPPEPGDPIDPSGQLLCPGCTHHVDGLGDHLLCCPRNNYIARHGAVQDVLLSLLSDAGQGCTKEVTIPNADAALRPADLLVRNWHGGKDTAMDITICHGWQAREQTVGRERWRTFLKCKKGAKHKKYDEVCDKAGWHFVALAFGTWGGMGPECAKTLNTISKRAAGWQEGDLRASQFENARLAVGWALINQILTHLQAKNFL